MFSRSLWITWLVTSIFGISFFAYAINVDNTPLKRTLLPGPTTHGHYQIELDCNACHTRFMGVKQDACMSCHSEDLTRETDTHPASKFNDPTNAERLATLDAQQCITCHREHVPNRTHTMGLSLPTDFCFHCHQDVGEQRPSHVGLKHDSCQTVGCHNYHDNRALYESFLAKHADEPDLLPVAQVPLRTLMNEDTAITESRDAAPLNATSADAPSDLMLATIVGEWSGGAHANAGVNCRHCHDVVSADGHERRWHNKVSHDACGECHARERESFTRGRHGMRIASELSPMTPNQARLPMHAESGHKQLTCNACHPAHRDDTRFAAASACMQCHDDEHTNAYRDSSHFLQWQAEIAGDAEPGTGVSCATCHMPRLVLDDGSVTVQHNQNSNLRPNEKMVREVCIHCHGLQFTLNTLADTSSINACFQSPPSTHISSIEMAVEWFAAQERKRQQRRKK